jgi:hypothetical protein
VVCSDFQIAELSLPIFAQLRKCESTNFPTKDSFPEKRQFSPVIIIRIKFKFHHLKIEN